MKHPHRPVVAAAALAIAVAGVAGIVSAQSANVQRCEGKDGRVTYSNTQCPEGTVPIRKVNTDPPVSVEAKKAAQDLAKKDADAAKQLEKDQAGQEARDRKQVDQRAKADAKADAKAQEKCERAKRDLERAKTTRAELGGRAATVEMLQKADLAIGRHEADIAKDCAR
ncbi:MAG: DUF4124 domain-containing protein [Burkholderiaceae bacterium]